MTRELLRAPSSRSVGEGRRRQTGRERVLRRWRAVSQCWVPTGLQILEENWCSRFRAPHLAYDRAAGVVLDPAEAREAVGFLDDSVAETDALNEAAYLKPGTCEPIDHPPAQRRLGHLDVGKRIGGGRIAGSEDRQK